MIRASEPWLRRGQRRHSVDFAEEDGEILKHRPSAHLTTRAKRWTVELPAIGAEEKFGFYARKVGAYVDSMVMGVEAIHAGGVLARFNFSQPESAVRVDDVVLAINGTHQGQKGLQIRAREP